MSTGYSRDVADTPAAYVDFDWDAVFEDDEREQEEVAGDRLRKIIDAEVEKRCAEKIQLAVIRLLAQMVDSNNYRLKIDVAIMASGFPFYQGLSFTEMGAKHRISKQAFSKHVLKFQDELGLPPTRGQKSRKARETYRDVHNRKNHGNRRGTEPVHG